MTGRFGTWASRSAVLVLLALAACNPTQRKPQEMDPLLADLVDYRNGLALLREGRADEAIQLLRRSRLTNPADPAVPNALGLALLYKKDYIGANKAFSDALKLDANFIEAHNNRGVSLMEIGKLDDAEADFQIVLDSPVTKEKPNARFNMGLLRKKREQWRDAEREFSLVLADDPDYRAAYRERGLARIRRDDFHGALEDFLRVLKDEPNDPISNYQSALCLLTEGRRDLARRYMERAADAAPESEEGKHARRFLDGEKSMNEDGR